MNKNKPVDTFVVISIWKRKKNKKYKKNKERIRILLPQSYLSYNHRVDKRLNRDSNQWPATKLYLINYIH